MNRQYKGFSYFDDIVNGVVRSWNQYQTVQNIFTDIGKKSAEEYMKQLRPGERKAIFTLAIAVMKRGEDEVRAEVNRREVVA